MYKKRLSTKVFYWLSIALIITAFITSRFTFYQTDFYPRFQSDSYFYFYTGYLINSKSRMLLDVLPIDIPLGYPLLTAILFKTSRSVIIVFQSLFFLSSILVLFRTLFQIYPKKRLHFLILLLLYVFDNALLKLELGFYIEPLFTACVLFFCSSLLSYLKKECLIYLALLNLCLFLLIIFRSNGYVFLVIPLFLFFEIKKHRLHISLFFITTLVALSTINLYFKNYFFPLELKRIQSTILNKSVLKNKSIYKNDYLQNSSHKSKILKSNLNFYLEEESSFYISYNPEIGKNIEESKKLVREDLKAQITPEVRSKILGDYENIHYNGQNNNVFLKKICHYFGRIKFILVNNIFIYVTSIFIGLLVIFKISILKKELNREEIFCLYIFLLFVLNIFFNTVSGAWISSRYVVPFEILIPFIFVMNIKIVTNSLYKIFEIFRKFS